jgi:hypothetical protein
MVKTDLLKIETDRQSLFCRSVIVKHVCRNIYIPQKAVELTLLRPAAALLSMFTTVPRPFLGQPESRIANMRKQIGVFNGCNKVRERRTPTGLLTAEERRKSAVK